MLQIADHRDREPVHRADFVSDGKDVEQRLRGMLADTVAGVQQRLPAMLRGPLKKYRGTMSVLRSHRASEK